MPLETILLILAVVAFFYFMLIRPMRKQVAAQNELRASLEVGSRVLLTSGIHGTIRHLGERQAIVELAPGTEVTVVKQAITGIVKPEDEEFEYDDEIPTAEPTLVDPLAEDREPLVDAGDSDPERQSYSDRDSTDRAGADDNSTDQNKGL